MTLRMLYVGDDGLLSIIYAYSYKSELSEFVVYFVIYHGLNTMCFTGIPANRWKFSSTGDLREWRKMELICFGVKRDTVRRLNTQHKNVPSCVYQMHLPPFCDQRKTWSRWNHPAIDNSFGCNQNNHASKKHLNVWEYSLYAMLKSYMIISNRCL